MNFKFYYLDQKQHIHISGGSRISQMEGRQPKRGNHYSFFLGENICWWHILNQPQQINASAFVVLPTQQKRVTILGRRQVVKVACWNEAEKNPPRDKSTQALSSFLSFYSFIKIHQNRAHYIFILYRSLQAVKSFLFPPFSSAWKGGFRLGEAYYATSNKTPIINSAVISCNRWRWTRSAFDEL